MLWRNRRFVGSVAEFLPAYVRFYKNDVTLVKVGYTGYEAAKFEKNLGEIKNSATKI